MKNRCIPVLFGSAERHCWPLPRRPPPRRKSELSTSSRPSSAPAEGQKAAKELEEKSAPKKKDLETTPGGDQRSP